MGQMQHTMEGMEFHMLIMWFAIGLVLVVLIGFVFLMTRPALHGGVPLSRLISARVANGPFPIKDAISQTTEATDTVFILPDISNYTSFMTGSQFSFGHAQHIIFSLVNVMIEAATSKIELSKLEGDAALFFVDADKYSEQELGETVMSIFRAFFRERRRLTKSNICPCHACSHIDLLDLKIFVHRGEAARFEFRGSIDLFGTDVIVLHRIMKNGVKGHRYVMVTDAASGSIELSGAFDKSFIEEDVQHVGKIRASVYHIDDAAAGEMADDMSIERLSVIGETLAKLRENIRWPR